MAGGADEDINLSWPTNRRDSCEGGYVCDEDRGRNEYRYATQLPKRKSASGGECHDEQPITEDSTFHRYWLREELRCDDDEDDWWL
jgi:hypothetical protein